MIMMNVLLCALLAVLPVISPTSAQGTGPGELCQALSGYMRDHGRCIVLGYCHQVECNYDGVLLHGALTVHSCESPVQVVLRVVAQSFDWSNTFNVLESQRHCQMDMPMNSQLYTSYSRNASHLRFEAHAIVEGDIATDIIPAIEIPLNLSNCTCADLEDATEHFHFPIPGVTHQCSVDDSTCLGFLCHISYGDTQLDSDAVIDPCSENLTVTVTDSGGMQVFRQVFSQSQALRFNVETFTPTLYVLINHYTYSMTVSVVMNIFSTNTTLLPEERIILDRSSCSSLSRFPAAPLNLTFDDCPPDLPTKGSSSSSLAVEVAVPILLMILLVATCIAIAVCLGFFYLRKKREVRFRRVAFERMEEDDDMI